MTKLLSRLLIFSTVLSCLVSCSKDDGEEPLPDRLGHINDLYGLWLSSDNTNSWFLVTAADHQTGSVDFNSTGLYWDGLYSYFGVPRLHTEGGETVIDNYGSPLLIIEDYNANKGLLTLYNPNFTDTKQFCRSTPGNVACIVDESVRDSYSRIDISVYAEDSDDELTLIYNATLPGGAITIHSVPFWTGSVMSTVKAEFTSGYTGKKTDAIWTHLEPDKYYTLTL